MIDEAKGFIVYLLIGAIVVMFGILSHTIVEKQRLEIIQPIADNATTYSDLNASLRLLEGGLDDSISRR